MAREREQEQEQPNGERQAREAVATVAHEVPDVVLDVPSVSVDEIHLHVAQLSARVSLDTAVAEKLVRIRAGVDVDLDKVELELKGVQAEAHLRVKLDNITRVVSEALAALRDNAGLVEALLGSTERAAGELASQASPVSKAAASLGDRVKQAPGKQILDDLDVSGRAKKLRETSKLAARKVKRGMSRAVSALPGRRHQADTEQPREANGAQTS